MDGFPDTVAEIAYERDDEYEENLRLKLLTNMLRMIGNDGYRVGDVESLSLDRVRREARTQRELLFEQVNDADE